MNQVQVIPVTRRAHRRQFLSLPQVLHVDNPFWVPRMRMSECQLVGFRRHPFWDFATSQSFIAVRHGRTVGRIVAIDNPHHRQRYVDEDLGFVGFFDCCDDSTVSNALFDCAAAWLAQRGLTVMRGPVSPSMNYEAGLLIDGFEMMPTFMMPYNPSYYVGLWNQYGFEKVQDMYAFVGDLELYRRPAQKAWQIARQAAERFKPEFRRIDRRTFVADVRSFLQLYNTASRGTWGFVPFTEAEIKHLADELRFLIIPELTSFMYVDGKQIGATFGLLDYNPIVKRIGGRLLPFGFVSLLMGKRTIRKSRCMSINVIPEYQRWGLGLCLLDRYLCQGADLNILHGEFSYVLESNHLAVATLRNGGAKCEKTYRVFEKPVANQMRD